MASIIPFFIQHLGCPHRCLFCNQNSIAGVSEKQEYPQREILDTVINEWLARFRSPADVQLAFYGGSFTCLPAEVQVDLLESITPYLERGQIRGVRLSTRPDWIDEQVCARLARYQVRTVELGVQSMNDEVLERAVRGHSAADVRHAVEVLTRNGFSYGIQLMVGLPGETTVSFLRSVEAVIELEPDFVRLYPVLVLKNTGLAALYEEGEFTPLHLNQAITLIRKARSRFTQNNIDVIRIGLQPSAELEENVIAGPYHPSLGACVMSRDFYLRARNIMERSRAGAEVVITLCDRDYSAFVGMRRSNIKRLEQRFPDRKLSVMIDPTIKRGEVRHAFC